jgi:hypothetical protein
MAAIYDNALKRKDLSGVVNKEEKDKHKDKTKADDNCIHVYLDLCFRVSALFHTPCRHVQGVSVQLHPFPILVNLHVDTTSFSSHFLS